MGGEKGGVQPGNPTAHLPGPSGAMAACNPPISHMCWDAEVPKLYGCIPAPLWAPNPCVQPSTGCRGWGWRGGLQLPSPLSAPASQCDVKIGLGDWVMTLALVPGRGHSPELVVWWKTVKFNW